MKAARFSVPLQSARLLSGRNLTSASAEWMFLFPCLGSYRAAISVDQLARSFAAPRTGCGSCKTNPKTLSVVVLSHWIEFSHLKQKTTNKIEGYRSLDP